MFTFIARLFYNDITVLRTIEVIKRLLIIYNQLCECAQNKCFIQTSLQVKRFNKKRWLQVLFKFV